MSSDYRIALEAFFAANPNPYHAIIDVRTPLEFAKDHIAGAVNLPVLNNEERHEVGTLYAADPFLGKKRGAALIAANIARHLSHPLFSADKHFRPLLYCWRGGKRSGAFTHILRQIGWRADQLQGGYKAYRGAVIAALDTLPQALSFVVIGGPTGCGKSLILRQMQKMGAQVLDLEDLANHKGSLLGADINIPQPSQTRFETLLWQALRGMNPKRPVFVESESRRIGTCHLPERLMNAIRAGRCVLIEADMNTRADIILADYAGRIESPDWLTTKITQFAPWQSAERLLAWQGYLKMGDYRALAISMMEHHYDPAYRKSLHSHFDINNAKTYTLQGIEEITMVAQQILAENEGLGG